MDRLSEAKWKQLVLLKRVGAGELTMKEAAAALGMSVRNLRRLRRRFERAGSAGLQHGNLGRVAKSPAEVRRARKVVALARGKYSGINDHHLAELLKEREGIALSRSTIRRQLRAAGVGAVKKRRAARHHKRRERKAQSGLMVLWDGSRHAWLEERGPMLCLMGAIDDATSEMLPGAHFLEQESAAGYLHLLRELVCAKGLPASIYGDRHGSLKRNDDHWTLEEELRGEQDPTHVGRALRALAIEQIHALSAQAKGRVERLWGTLQDRLVSELRLAKARTCAQANAVLSALVGRHNRRFQVTAADATLAWRSVRPGTDIERICSLFYECTVGNDNAVRIGRLIIDIPPGPAQRSYAKARVEVRQLLDGSWRVYLADRLLATRAAGPVAELRALKRRKRGRPSRSPTHSFE